MNNANKKKLNDAYGKLEEAKAVIEQIAQDMRDMIDGKSDKWRESEAGETAEQEQNLRAAFV